MANSNYLRQSIKNRRKSLDIKIVIKKSEDIIKNLIKQPFFNYHSSIFLYSSFLNEVKTDSLLKISGIKGKKIGLPLIRNNNIVPGLILKREFKKGKFNIIEPVTDKEFVFDEKTIIIIPLIIFDINCNRIGFGKGYYDRFLKKVKGLKLGFAYELQKVKEIKKKYYDIPLDIIVTEKKIIRRKR
ncbi:MAG TPA: 5-formyltetrahydrofolate cyclo-ligase [Spirochaetota bacterium]|nr:5-formyltetrahydrofolate cyclo-ligase [Spirochaetota bacterium]HOM38565.1 5-formyltetrahydrofolate cyclo-ligase [Spirochaetota bacterium]HPQ49702.1 5-formyltetrahydrofolate cyclo-ligase [Spirochaetota bacterium]